LFKLGRGGGLPQEVLVRHLERVWKGCLCGGKVKKGFFLRLNLREDRVGLSTGKKIEQRSRGG
jgi:hypothetical protein